MLVEIYQGSQDKEHGALQKRTRQDSACDSGSSEPMTSPNRAITNGLEEPDIMDIDDFGHTIETPKKDSWPCLLNLVLQLRKVGTHPYLIDDAMSPVNLIGSHVYENSGKFMTCTS